MSNNMETVIRNLVALADENGMTGVALIVAFDGGNLDNDLARRVRRVISDLGSVTDSTIDDITDAMDDLADAGNE